jgi:hypothetical protein
MSAIKLRDLMVAIVMVAPILAAVILAPKMHWYYGWPFALLCLLVFLYLRNIIQSWLLKKLSAEATLKQQQD